MAAGFREQSPRPREKRRPSISVVVVIHNIPREAPRTLYSLSARYQRHIEADDYEVIVVDNGSVPALDRQVIDDLEGNFRLIRIDPAPPSPAYALNRGLAAAQGDIIGVMIDGARMVTPGLLHFARHGAQLYDRAVVATLGWYLGHDFQRVAMTWGYDKTREDELLSSIGWPQDGYRLFEIATLDESSLDGWFFPTAESNALFLKREMWTALGGLEERFDEPGGGFLNLDTFRRAIQLPDGRLVMLLGEGTFHQLHSGKATNAPPERHHADVDRWKEQYAAIRGEKFSLTIPTFERTYIGVLPRAALVRVLRAALDPVFPTRWGSMLPVEPPLGQSFDRALWSCAPTQKPADPNVAALLDLAQEEFRARRHDAAASIARLTCSRHPAEPEFRRLLALASGWLQECETSTPRSYAYHRALSRAHALLGDRKTAAFHRRLAHPHRLKRIIKKMAGRTIDMISVLGHPFDTHERELLRRRLKAAARELSSKVPRPQLF